MLEQALSAFPGTIVAVSHDRYFLDRMCDRLLMIRHNEHGIYDGNYSYYIEQVEQQRGAADATARVKKEKRSKPAARQPSGPKPVRSRFAKLKLDEPRSAHYEARNKADGDARTLRRHRVYQDPDAIAELRDEFERLQAELAEAETEWNTRAERE